MKVVGGALLLLLLLLELDLLLRPRSRSGGVLISDVLCSTEVEQRFKADNACVWFGDAKRCPPSQSFFTSHAAFFLGAQVGC